MAPAAVDPNLLPTGMLNSKPAGHVVAVDQRDRRTDGQTHDRYIDSAPYTMPAASII